MWPKLLDLSPDECRGMLRRLELQSYSSVVSTFRAQGILNEMKVKILRDLREAFHISEDRHRAEVRRVVNDEAFSTVAKVVYGPNSEIEWNKEGARGFSILPRATPQTALSVLADKAAELGDELNAKLPQPASTQRNHVLRPTEDHKEFAAKIVTADPLQIKVESKRQITLPLKSKPPPIIDWSTANKSRKRGSNKLNLPNNATRIQQLYNSHNSKTNAAPSQPKPTIQGSATSQTAPKSTLVTNRRRKSELLSPIARVTEPAPVAAVHPTEHSIRDNEYQLQEEEVNSVPLHSHKYTFNAALADAIAQVAAAEQSPMQIQQTIVTAVPNASTPSLPRISTVRPSQTQIVYQQQLSAPKLTKATAAAVAKPNVKLENSNRTNGAPRSTLSQFALQKNSNVISSTTVAATTTQTTTAQRIPPKINILSQQTITKSNINFVPLADNKIIMKSDSKLANAFKSQKIQMIPGQMSSPASASSSSPAGHKMHPQNNLIIRGTSQHTMHPKVFSVPLNSNHQSAQAFYVNMPTTQSPRSNASIPAHAIHTIEKVITEETPAVEIFAAETDDYIIEETTGTAYESVEQNVDDTAAYVTTTTKVEPTPTKRVKLSNNENRTHDHRHRTSFVTPKVLSNASQEFRTHVANNELVSTIIYEEHPTGTDWEYELDYEQGRKSNGNGQTIVNGEVVVEDDATEYHDSNIIYTEEEIIDDDNVMQEEYVTTEVFSPNDNVIEMEIDSVNHTYHDAY